MTLFVVIAAAALCAGFVGLLIAIALGRAAARSDSLFDGDARLLLTRQAQTREDRQS